MNNLLKILVKSFRRVLAVGLIGLSLWSLSAPAYAADANDYYKNDRGEIQGTERYDTIQSEKGGMNNFDAVDPRRNTTEADAKAQTLLDVAKRRKAMASDPLEPAREAVDNLKDKTAATTSELASDLKETAQDVGSTLQNASRDISEDLSKAGDNLAENISKRADAFDESAKQGRVPNQMN